MSKKLFTTGQVAELYVIEKVLVETRGYGLHGELQEIIARYTSGGVGSKSDDLRVKQAKVFWDYGWGRELKLGFENYLASVPPIPDRPADMPAHFDRLVLRDARPFRSEEGLSITNACRMLSVTYRGTDETLIPHDPAPTIPDLAWVWCQDGRRNRNVATSECRHCFEKRETGMDAMTGLLLFAQDRNVIGGKDSHAIDLPGSVDRDAPSGVPSGCAYLSVGVDGGPAELACHFRDSRGPTYGSGSCWGVEC